MISDDPAPNQRHITNRLTEAMRDNLTRDPLIAHHAVENSAQRPLRGRCLARSVAARHRGASITAPGLPRPRGKSPHRATAGASPPVPIPLLSFGHIIPVRRLGRGLPRLPRSGRCSCCCVCGCTRYLCPPFCYRCRRCHYCHRRRSCRSSCSPAVIVPAVTFAATRIRFDEL